ncbi:MAG: hypothetical protein IJW62_01385 [Clostridia bacterium]|nr:hypothetical protein [Clostridia bacterium]
MKTKLSINSLIKLILMELVIIVIYFHGIGLLPALIMIFFIDPYIRIPIPLPEGASWTADDHVLIPNEANSEFIHDMSVCIIAFILVVAASFFLNNIRYWLYSLIPQAVIFNLHWLYFASDLEKFNDELFWCYITNYWLSIATVFGAQLIGVLINFLFRWIARKLRARKAPVPAV